MISKSKLWVKNNDKRISASLYNPTIKVRFSFPLRIILCERPTTQKYTTF